MSSIDATLSERGQRYGKFEDHAEHSLAIKALFFTLLGEEKAKTLKADQVEALNMIAHKLARITNGDPHYDDSWRDVAGYAQLVANRLAKDAANAKSTKPTKPTKPTKARERDAVCDLVTSGWLINMSTEEIFASLSDGPTPTKPKKEEPQVGVRTVPDEADVGGSETPDEADVGGIEIPDELAHVLKRFFPPQ